jgi:hypothetical protein
MDPECLEILLNEGKWTNQSLKEMEFNIESQEDCIESLKKFISLNTPVQTLNISSGTPVQTFDGEIVDFGKELKLNSNIVCVNDESIMSKYYMHRNVEYLAMSIHFKVIPIFQVKKFDCSFYFQ